MWDDAQGLEEHWKIVKMRSENGEDGSSFDDDDYEDADLGGTHSRGSGPQMIGNDLAGVFKD